MNEEYTVLQVAVFFLVLAAVVAGAAWFLASWRVHDEQGRPRRPDAGP